MGACFEKSNDVQGLSRYQTLSGESASVAGMLLFDLQLRILGRGGLFVYQYYVFLDAMSIVAITMLIITTKTKRKNDLEFRYWQ